MEVTRLALVATSCALVLTGCAIGDPPDAAGPDTRLHPHLKPEHQKHHGKQSRGHRVHGARGAETSKHGSRPHAKPTKSGGGVASAPSSSPSASSTGQVGATAPPPGPDSAQVSDEAGDVRGIGAPSFADLTDATLTSAGGYTLVVDVAAALPASSADKTMHVILFVDVDGDGQIDYENWATLADDGWSGAWRYPDGAKFGGASGIRVSVSGSRLTMSFPTDHVGNADHFRWLVGAEYGSDAQMASGTQSSDYAPDNGGVDFPAR